MVIMEKPSKKGAVKHRVRLMQVTFTMPEESVGGVIADLTGRATLEAVGTVELVDGRSFKQKTVAPKAKKTPALKSDPKDRILIELANGPKSRKYLMKEAGLSKNSFSVAMKALLTAKAVKRIGHGKYEAV